MKTEEHSTLVAAPVTASCPRVVAYVVNNIQKSADAEFAGSLEALGVRTAGEDNNSYLALLAEIERPDRDCPIILVSPSRDGEYLVEPVELQRKLIGLGQVVQVTSGFNSYEMAEILGRPRSAWNGAINVLHIPSLKGFVYGHLFLSEEIERWSNAPDERIDQLLAHVTDKTNVRRLRKHVRPDGVIQLALRRRLQSLRARSEQMDSVQLRAELDKAVAAQAAQQEWIDTVERCNADLQSDLVDARTMIAGNEKALNKWRFENEALKQHLENAGGQQDVNAELEGLLILACSPGPPTPSKCLEVIEKLYPANCTILQTAKDSAADMDLFTQGRRLLNMLRLLVTEYRAELLQGGDDKARRVFGKNEYAAKESETVMKSKDLRRLRTFSHKGEDIEMFRHLKIGCDDNIGKTIRVHFHRDAESNKIVIGYCGKHLPIASR